MSAKPGPKPPARKQSLDEAAPKRENDTKVLEVAKRALHEHEDLKRKFSKKEEQTRQLKAELDQTKAILNQLESVSTLVVEEFQDVQCKLDIETQCREEAVKFASHKVREIKELKRKSQMIFQQNGIDFSKIVDISIDDEPDVETSQDSDVADTEAPLAPLPSELEIQINVLKDELLRAKKDLAYAVDERDLAREDLNGAYFDVSTLREELRREVQSHEKTKKALQERDNIINQLKRVSALVYDEFTDIQKLYQQESAMREQAETLASEYYAKNKEAEAFKRQSAMLLNDAIGGDMKLIESMSEVEKLTKEVEEEREKHKLEMKRLQEELEQSQDREKMEQLENKLSIAREENESLEKRVGELDLRNKELAYDLKEALARPSLPNIPPPPPPPPMPVLPKNPLEMLQNMIGRKRGKKQQADPDERHLDNYQKKFETAMQDMITRIQKGQVKLKPTRVNEKAPSEKPLGRAGSSKAVQELDGILKHMHKRRGGPIVAHSKTNVTEPDSQLQSILKKRLQKTSEAAPPTSKMTTNPTGPKAQPRSPSKLNKSTSLDSAALPHRTGPPQVASRRPPLTLTTSTPSPMAQPDPVYSMVSSDEPPSPLSTHSSIVSSSSSSQDIEVQANPAFIQDSGDETYASADLPSPATNGRSSDPRRPPVPAANAYRDPNAKFAVAKDYGEAGEYSLVQARPERLDRPKPRPSPRRQPSAPKQTEPEPYYSEVNMQ